MSIIATTSSSDKFVGVSTGVHKARCVRMIDLGTQRSEYQGEVSWKRQILVSWEVPSELSNSGEPLLISKFYTLSLHEKSNLGKDLTAWRGRAFTELEKQQFDITALLGVPCMLNIVEGRNGNTKVGSVMPLPKNDTLEPQFHENLQFSIDDFENGSNEAFMALSEGIRNIILRSKELENMNTDLGDENNGADIGDVPF
jgi:hypothetical protein|tara:strand:- start:64 stop:660 length:597 start_codon:yes stop_codon:yes gene_type:complete